MHVVTVPERAEALFRLVDEFERRELAEGLRAKPRAGLEKRYAYELWEHPSRYSWVRRDEIIPVRTISHWYLIHPDGWVKAVTTTDHEPGWKDPQRLIKAEHRLSRYNASDLKSFKATSLRRPTCCERFIDKAGVCLWEFCACDRGFVGVFCLSHFFIPS